MTSLHEPLARPPVVLRRLPVDDHHRNRLRHLVGLEVTGIRSMRRERASSPGGKSTIFDSSVYGHQDDCALAEDLQTGRARRSCVYEHHRADAGAVGSKIKSLRAVRISLSRCRECHRGRSDGRQGRSASAQSAPPHRSPFVGRLELGDQPIPQRYAGQSDEPVAQAILLLPQRARRAVPPTRPFGHRPCFVTPVFLEGISERSPTLFRVSPLSNSEVPSRLQAWSRYGRISQATLGSAAWKILAWR